MRSIQSFLHSLLIALCTGCLTSTVIADEMNSSPAKTKGDASAGYGVVEGEIVVLRSPPDGRQTPSATPIGDPDLLWPGGIVPFEFDGNVTSAHRTNMLNAMAEWEKVATVTFVPHTSQLNWLYIVDSFANGSAVGRPPVPGPELVHIQDWEFRFSICHELGHALGLYHEQGRPDRDDFVRIEWDHINLIDQPQFKKETSSKKYGPYDFDSVMHYHQCNFSKCGAQDCANNPTADCRTITVLPPNSAMQSQIGQHTHLSFWDQRIMSFMYPKSNWRFVDATAGYVGSGSFYSPFWFLTMAISDVPAGGTLWLLQPGTYVAPATITKRMTLRAPLGGAVLTR